MERRLVLALHAGFFRHPHSLGELRFDEPVESESPPACFSRNERSKAAVRGRSECGRITAPARWRLRRGRRIATGVATYRAAACSIEIENGLRAVTPP
jgi:hypothetical protein